MANTKKTSRQKSKKDTREFIDDELDKFEYTNKDRKVDIIKKLQFLPGIAPKNEKQKKLLKKIHDNKVIFITGPAGSGKTFITIKGVLEVLKKDNANIEHILITKPIVEAGGESIGFLPGDINEKIDPYMHSFESTFKKIIGDGGYKALYNSGTIKTVPIPYIRGNTFQNVIAILDEAQNVSFTGLKLFLSRIGENSKIIILGDADQTDLKLKSGEIHALPDAFKRFEGVNGMSFMEFNEDDIVRSDILIDIMKRYRKEEKS